MKRIVFLAMLALAGGAYAQAEKPAAAKPEATKPEAPKPAAAKPAAKGAAVAKKHSSRRNEDARQCLERATNDAIIKCAEEYL
jgi:hypothetical protein